MTATTPERIEIMKVPITVFDSYEYASRFLAQNARRRHRALCVAINPIKVYKAWKDKQLWNTINAADFCLCDGVGMAAAVRLLHGRTIPRITGIQLFFDLVTQAEVQGLKIFLLGAKPRSNQGAYERLQQRHPRLQIVGRNHGYFHDSDAVVRQINDSQADMLFVAMGSPRQEKWLAQYRDRIDTPFCMGVGGSFDVLGGTARRAPHVFQRTGTEWLYRLIVQPKRLREQIVLPLFALRVLRQFLVANLTRTWRVNGGRPLKTHGSTQTDRAQGDNSSDSHMGAADSKTGTNTAFGQKPWREPHRQPSLTKSIGYDRHGSAAGSSIGS